VTSLSEKKCNILTNNCFPPEWGSEEDKNGVRLTIENKDRLEFRKGFFEEDVREAVLRLKKKTGHMLWFSDIIDEIFGEKLT